jgi:hypothetical protein
MPKPKLACADNGAIIGAAPAILGRHELSALYSLVFRRASGST